MFLYIGELCRYLLDQPAKPIDTKLHLRKFIGNGLRAGIWKPLQKRYCIPNIVEFYGLTEGNVLTVNLVNKPGAVGYISRFFPFLQNLTVIKINPVNGEYLRDSRGFCVQAEVNEPGEGIGKISKRTLWGPAPLRRREDLEAGMLQIEHARTCKQMQDKARRLNQIELINFANV